MEYGVRQGVEPDMLDTFWRLVYGMDSGYLDLQRGEFEKAQQQQKRALRSKSKRYGR